MFFKRIQGGLTERQRIKEKVAKRKEEVVRMDIEG